MMIRIIILVFFSTQLLYGQYSEKKISTDSSDITIVRNSVYKIWEETYRHKDSIWYSVRYIKDTTKINTEGWRKKNGQHIGIWREYTIDGELLYTWNHDSGVCDINSRMYPYYDLLLKMKSKADSIIINTYSKDFFENHVLFNYECNAYRGQYVEYSTGNFWIDDYVGSWIEPIKLKPNKFLFRYDIKYDNDQLLSRGIEMEIDSIGNYYPIDDSGFERIPSDSPRDFSFEKKDIIKNAQSHGLEITDSTNYFSFLTWVSQKTPVFYNGNYEYYVAEKYDEIVELSADEKGRSRVTEKFMVYSFNPWTGEFIETKKMKAIREWEHSSGLSTGLMPDK